MTWYDSMWHGYDMTWYDMIRYKLLMIWISISEVIWYDIWSRWYAIYHIIASVGRNRGFADGGVARVSVRGSATNVTFVLGSMVLYRSGPSRLWCGTRSFRWRWCSLLNVLVQRLFSSYEGLFARDRGKKGNSSPGSCHNLNSDNRFVVGRIQHGLPATLESRTVPFHSW